MRISTLQDKDGRFPGACWDWRLFIHQGCSPAPNTWPQHPKLADLGFCWFCRWTTVFHVVSVLFFWFKSGWTPSYIFLSHSDFLLSSYSNALPVFLVVSFMMIFGVLRAFCVASAGCVGQKSFLLSAACFLPLEKLSFLLRDVLGFSVAGIIYPFLCDQYFIFCFKILVYSEVMKTYSHVKIFITLPFTVKYIRVDFSERN